jgi:propionyl-CoA carboxylase alpha chain
MPVGAAIRSVLVANRGEIARRVLRTCREMAIDTVAVHSDADAGAPFVAEADHAVRLPGTASTDTYLRGELIIEAAQRAGADAIHPGYGFLSENAAFAQAVLDAGLVWIGPPPAAIAALSSKLTIPSRNSRIGSVFLNMPLHDSLSDDPCAAFGAAPLLRTLFAASSRLCSAFQRLRPTP